MPKKATATTPKTGRVPAAIVRQQNEKLKQKLAKFSSYAWCYMCDSFKSRDHFYVSTDPMIKSGICPICKECAAKIALRTDRNGHDHDATKESTQLALKYLNKPYHESVWDASVQEAQNLITGKIKTNVWAAYAKNIAMRQYVTETYFDSDFYKQKITYDDEISAEEKLKSQEGTETYDDYIKNKKDVIRLLGYDPFGSEAVNDQPFLYSQLLGLIDAGGDENEDMMRNSSCISIVRNFLQTHKIDNTIAHLMSDTKNIERNSATIKSLQDSKAKITSQITSLAAESCISLKNNKSAKKGENSWTGKLKKIKDMNIREGEMNGFSIEACKGMQQVADISTAAILKQLSIDESEYADMLAQQTKMIDGLDKECKYSKELLRIILRENLSLKDIIEQNNIDIGFETINLDELLFDIKYQENENNDG